MIFSLVSVQLIDLKFPWRDTWCTRSSAIAKKPRCSLFKLWQKYKCSMLRRWRQRIIILLFYGTMFVLNAKLSSIYAWILEIFGGLNIVSLSGFFGEFLCWRNLG